MGRAVDHKLSLKTYGAFLETIPDAALVVDRDGLIVHASTLAEQLFGVDGAGLAGRAVHELVPEDKRAGHVDRIGRYWQQPLTRRMGKGDFPARRLDGTEFPADIMLAPVSLSGRDLVLCVIRDLTEQKAQEMALMAALERERRLALSDPLVGVANKRHLQLAMEHEIEQLRRHGRAFTLIYLDLDEFKPLNDEFGHAEGDRVLVTLGAFLQTAVRKTDLVARVGGDEFVVLMVETAGLSARKRVPDFCASVAGFLDTSPWSITASVGVVVVNTAPRSVDEAISRADGLMLEVKRRGRAGCLAHYGAPDDEVETCDLRVGCPVVLEEPTATP